MDTDRWIIVAQVGKIRFVYYTGKVGFIPLKPKDVSYDEYQDILRARGLKKTPDSVAPGYFGDEALDRESDNIERQTDLESFNNLIDLMEQEKE